MRAVQLGKSRELTVVDRPLRDLNSHEVRIDVGYCGICGSDLHMRDVVDPGAIFGHEFAGKVCETGNSVADWSIGDAVAVLIYTNCGQCAYCQSGNENQCMAGGHHGDVIGVQIPGGYSESVIADEDCLFALPAGVSVRHGALTEPVAVAARAAAALSDLDTEDPVLVIGAGPIGLLTGFALKAQGSSDVIIVERNPRRAEVAAGLGFQTVTGNNPDAAVKRLGIGEPPAVIECAGTVGAINAALGLLRRQGRLVLIGLPVGPAEIDMETLILKEIRATGSAGYARSDFQTALDLLGSGDIPVDAVITGVVSLDETEQAFADLTEPSTTHVKILIEP